MPSEQFFSYIMARTSYIGSDTYDIVLVRDQHTSTRFCSYFFIHMLRGESANTSTCTNLSV